MCNHLYNANLTINYYFSSQTIQVTTPSDVGSIRLNDEWRTGSCPPGSSVPVTPVTTPTGGANISDFTVRITSDEFVYLRVTRQDYRQLRNQFEIRQAQKVSSIDNINNLKSTTDGATEQTTDQIGTRGNNPVSLSRRNTIHASLIDIKSR